MLAGGKARGLSSANHRHRSRHLRTCREPGLVNRHDPTEGRVDRFRLLPTSRSASLPGATNAWPQVAAEFAASMLAIIVLTPPGLAIGCRIYTHPRQAVARFTLLALVATALLWIGRLVGIIVRSPGSAMGGRTCLPLAFLSDAFVPATALPSAVRVRGPRLSGRWREPPPWVRVRRG